MDDPFQLALMSGVASSVVQVPEPLPTKLRLSGKVAEAVPVPFSVTTRGLLGSTGALLVKVSVLVSSPMMDGVNVIRRTQLAPANREVQLLFVEKSRLVNTGGLMVTIPVPVLESVTVWAEVVVNCVLVPKFTVSGETAMLS